MTGRKILDYHPFYKHGLPAGVTDAPAAYQAMCHLETIMKRNAWLLFLLFELTSWVTIAVPVRARTVQPRQCPTPSGSAPTASSNLILILRWCSSTSQRKKRSCRMPTIAPPALPSRYASCCAPMASTPKMAQVGRFSVQPVYDYKNPKRKLVGYRVDTDISIKIKDFSKVGPITEGIANMPDLSGNQSLSYELDDMDAAKVKAVEDALRRCHDQAARWPAPADAHWENYTTRRWIPTNQPRTAR